MMIKAADDRRADVAALERLRERSDVQAATRGRIEAEIRRIEAGERGERSLERFAQELAARHRPKQVDWTARFGLPAEIAPARESSTAEPPTERPTGPRGSGHRCASCGSPVSFAVVKFCWNNKQRFGSQIYCMADQARF